MFFRNVSLPEENQQPILGLTDFSEGRETKTHFAKVSPFDNNYSVRIINHSTTHTHTLTQRSAALVGRLVPGTAVRAAARGARYWPRVWRALHTRSQRPPGPAGQRVRSDDKWPWGCFEDSDRRASPSFGRADPRPAESPPSTEILWSTYLPAGRHPGAPNVGSWAGGGGGDGRAFCGADSSVWLWLKSDVDLMAPDSDMIGRDVRLRWGVIFGRSDEESAENLDVTLALVSCAPILSEHLHSTSHSTIPTLARVGSSVSRQIFNNTSHPLFTLANTIQPNNTTTTTNQQHSTTHNTKQHTNTKQ